MQCSPKENVKTEIHEIEGFELLEIFWLRNPCKDSELNVVDENQGQKPGEINSAKEPEAEEQKRFDKTALDWFVIVPEDLSPWKGLKLEYLEPCRNNGFRITKEDIAAKAGCILALGVCILYKSDH
ncbi:hypothetical protein Nepgr_013640 [Nepenthes gracilis]|uniref:Uncharacterized protein n=1 Tax=Nepenthes gracilis TaxID=150966 RepID=A0AAD3SJ83_NEPGR|nr:hypothetical protein Nepgr_013640 [Nepenthes gracilis]